MTVVMNIVQADGKTEPYSIADRTADVEIVAADVAMLILSKEIRLGFGVRQIAIRGEAKQTILILATIILVTAKVCIHRAPSINTLCVLGCSQLVLRSIRERIGSGKDLSEVGTLMIIERKIECTGVSHLR